MTFPSLPCLIELQSIKNLCDLKQCKAYMDLGEAGFCGYIATVDKNGEDVYNEFSSVEECIKILKELEP